MFWVNELSQQTGAKLMALSITEFPYASSGNLIVNNVLYFFQLSQVSFFTPPL